MTNQQTNNQELVIQDLQKEQYLTIIDLMILFVFSDMEANDNELLVINNFIINNQLDEKGITLEKSLEKFMYRVESLWENESIADVIIDKMKNIDKSKSKKVLSWIKELIYADWLIEVEEDELFKILLSELQIDNI